MLSGDPTAQVGNFSQQNRSEPPQQADGGSEACGIPQASLNAGIGDNPSNDKMNDQSFRTGLTSFQNRSGSWYR